MSHTQVNNYLHILKNNELINSLNNLKFIFIFASWYPPRDNGGMLMIYLFIVVSHRIKYANIQCVLYMLTGSDITNYVVERREAKTTTWTKVSSYVTSTYCRIRNLTVGRDYEFRVMAENQYGTSDPAETTEPIKAKHPFDVPGNCCFIQMHTYMSICTCISLTCYIFFKSQGPPGTPRSVETTEDSITLSCMLLPVLIFIDFNQLGAVMVYFRFYFCQQGLNPETTVVLLFEDM